VVLSILFKNEGPQRPVYEWEEEDDGEEELNSEHIDEETTELR